MLLISSSSQVLGQFDSSAPGQRGLQRNQGPQSQQGRPRGRGAAQRSQGSPLLLVLDADRDGIISADEIRNSINTLKQLDVNKDGRLEPTEYRPGSARLPNGTGRNGPSQRNPQQMANQQVPDAVQQSIDRLLEYDENEDGQLVLEELPSRLRSIFTRADRDNNGILTRRELVADARSQMNQSRSGDFQKPPESSLRSTSTELRRQLVDKLLDRLDRNQNEVLEAEEIPDRIQRQLLQLDANGDQIVDQNELSHLPVGSNRTFSSQAFVGSAK